MRESQKKAIKKYKEKVKRLTLEFSPTESELLDRINKQPKKQTYIKDLIRKDIEAEKQIYKALNPDSCNDCIVKHLCNKEKCVLQKNK